MSENPITEKWAREPAVNMITDDGFETFQQSYPTFPVPYDHEGLFSTDHEGPSLATVLENAIAECVKAGEGPPLLAPLLSGRTWKQVLEDTADFPDRDGFAAGRYMPVKE